MKPSILLLGASGGTGGALLRRLAAGDAAVVAWSRREYAQAAADDAARAEGIPSSEIHPAWQTGDLFKDSLPAVDAILSTGPLDGLVSAWSRSHLCRPRVVVALSSSSAAFKRDSIDPVERALAATLTACEARLAELCRERAARCVILRPTLIYGGDDARHFGAVAAQARRFGRVVLPASAHGLRMPIHVEDLAACMQAAAHANEASGSFDVGGGETLAYDAMLQRVLRARGEPARIVHCPDLAFRGLLACAHAMGQLRGLSHAMVLRMRDDLVVDDAPARQVLGHDPGPFRPAMRAGHGGWTT